MALSSLLDTLSPVFTFINDNPLLSLLLIPVLYTVLLLLYRISAFHPLHLIPGPPIARISSLYLLYHAWTGTEASLTHHLHALYGPIVRTGPNTIDISDGTALNPIYVANNGFAKPQFYENFALPDGEALHNSIFSETRHDVRAPRAKAVAVVFSTASLRQGQDLIYACVDKLVARLEEAKKSSRRSGGKPVNILQLTRGLAVDAVSTYLLGKCYGALNEGAVQKEGHVESSTREEDVVEPMSASGMVDTFVAVGRFWYLPSWAFKLVEKIDAWWNADEEVERSLKRVDDFVADVVGNAEAAIKASQGDEKSITATSNHLLTSYPARLLQAGFTASETRAQCKDLIFAGSDSTGMNLATILFMLVRHPECYKKLREEITTNKPGFDEVQTLPYLRGVIKEGLRLSMANPSRLPRVVPSKGWTFNDVYFPPGTEVSCTPYSMHLNPVVFPSPDAFQPERWLEPTDEMTRDSIPFGLGSRQCIARNLATVELYCAVAQIAEADILQGAQTLKENIEILEWFNSKVIGERIDLRWT